MQTDRVSSAQPAAPAIEKLAGRGGIGSGGGLRAWSRTKTRTSEERRLSTRKQILLQIICLLITLTVIFPILWILSISVDPRGLTRPDGLKLIPPGISFDAYGQVIARPTSNPISFLELARNSLIIASVTALVSVGIGLTAGYAFSRMRFRFREALMLSVLAVLMLPAVATIAPLFVLLTRIQIGDFVLGRTILGVIIAITASVLPFAIWNLKGYLDTIPKDLEEAAAVDGATRNQTFMKIVIPLAKPAIAVTAFLGFIAGWTEFYFSVIFLSDVKQFTLSIALNGMVGQYATQTPWSQFAAFSILFALPVSVVYFFAQKYIIGGLAVGGVKG
jgi:arabinogalactan oligomer / maltooligosaccharide transport system permease protein